MFPFPPQVRLLLGSVYFTNSRLLQILNQCSYFLSGVPPYEPCVRALAEGHPHDVISTALLWTRMPRDAAPMTTTRHLSCAPQAMPIRLRSRTWRTETEDGTCHLAMARFRARNIGTMHLLETRYKTKSSLLDRLAVDHVPSIHRGAVLRNSTRRRSSRT